MGLVKTKINPCLWFDGQAEEAARYYCAVFKDSKILGVTHYGDHGWLKDKNGLTWQVVPAELMGLMLKLKATPEQLNRMMKAVQGMVKLDLAAIKRAYQG